MDLGKLFALALVLSSCSLHYAGCQLEPPLFLTPLIKSGLISEAQNSARVHNFLPGSISYSGFITVNEEYNSNLFFWYFPATSANASAAPVILWSEGGPGITLFHSLFSQNGPFKPDPENATQLTRREISWRQGAHIIYLDSPVNVGFSFTENEAGNVHSGPGAAGDIYEFLLQFFTLFPNLRENEFYNGGVSYGATYATAVANYIHERRNGSEPRINLRGILLESPWLDPETQIDYGPYLFNLGLIGEKEKVEFDGKRDRIRELVGNQDYETAFGIWAEMSQKDAVTLTGYAALYNIEKDEFPPFNFTDAVTTQTARNELHVGNRTFSYVSPVVQANMNKNMLASAKPMLETLLQAGYKTIFWTGNFDGTTGHLGLSNAIASLNWDGREELVNGPRSIWRVDGRVAGYVKTAGNVTYVIMRNAGHGTSGDQPKWAFDLLQRFTLGTPFSS